jgi:copper homeostasis protein
MRTLVEICIESVDDAKAAAGVDRLELCQALAVGGLTPSIGVQKAVREFSKVPLMTMIRPRTGGFFYSEAEYNVMRRDIDAAIDLRSDGIVFGILTESGDIDMARSEQIVRQIRSCQRQLHVVFHRAFDFTPDPFEALDRLIELGVTRVLTSGQQPTATGGAALIRALVKWAAGRIQILPGGGIRPDNVCTLLDQTGCDQLHASLRTAVTSAALRTVPLGDMSEETSFTATDAVLVRSLLAAVE